MLDFLPLETVSYEWLEQLYRHHIVKSKAVGKDGIRHSQFERMLREEINLIIKRLNERTYKFTNYREILVARGCDRFPRQISVPTIRDRLVLRAALEHLKHAFSTALPSAPHRYIKDIKTHLSDVRENSSFLRMDIRDFYLSIRHDILLDALYKSSLDVRFIEVIRKAIETPTGHSQKKPAVGIPQGLAVSNILASIYMQDFDKHYPKGAFYRRYVDDILVIGPSESMNNIYSELHQRLTAIGLSSHPMGKTGKTEIARLSDGVNYLGYNVSSDNVSVRPESLARMFTNLSKVLTILGRGKHEERHLFRLNLKITGCIINSSRRGWLMFFSQTDDLSQLAFLDTWLKRELGKLTKLRLGEVKTFKRAYYETKFNLSDTKYIPKFDDYTYNQKVDVVRILSGKEKPQIEAMDFFDLENDFSRLIGKEVSELERDLIQSFS